LYRSKTIYDLCIDDEKNTQKHLTMKNQTRGLMTSFFLMAALVSVGQSTFVQAPDLQITTLSEETSPNEEPLPKLWFSFDMQHLNINAYHIDYFGIGGGSAFSARFQFDILEKGKAGLSGVLGAGMTQLKYDGPVSNEFNNKSFTAIEHALTLTTGLILSFRNPQERLESFDLEASGCVWFYDRDYWESPNYVSYYHTGEKYSLFLSPMYSRGFEQIRFSVGPFANMILSERPKSNSQSLQYAFGLRMIFGLGL
jgi:hypothetical protein